MNLFNILKRFEIVEKVPSGHRVILATGFMIVETVIAVSIIVFALIGPLSAAKSSLNVASDARDYVESVYLADEIMEYVRLIRDNNIFQYNGNGAQWLTGLSTCTGVGKSCGIGVSDGTGSNIVDCLNVSCELKYNNSTLRYSYKNSAGWASTGITRSANIIETVSGKEALVTITINRRRLNYPTRTYVMKGILMNWKKQLSP